MGVHILSDGENAVLYCSSSDWAFGPVFGPGYDAQDKEVRDCKAQCERFLRWIDGKGLRVRALHENQLADEYGKFNQESPNYYDKADLQEGLDVPDCLKSEAAMRIATGRYPNDLGDEPELNDVVADILDEDIWRIKVTA